MSFSSARSSNFFTASGSMRNLLLRSFVNVYKGDEDIRYLEGQDTEVADGDELSIIPSIAGGRCR